MTRETHAHRPRTYQLLPWSRREPMPSLQPALTQATPHKV